MIPFKTAIGGIELPSSFDEITLGDFMSFIENRDPVFVFSKLLNLTPDKVQILDLDSLAPFIEFLKDDPLESVEPSATVKLGDKEITLSDDLGSYQWAQKLLSLDELREGKNIEALAVYLQPLYSGNDFNPDELEPVIDALKEKTVSEYYSIFKHYLNGIEAVIEKDKDLSAEITFEQKAAGIDMFNQLGDFNLIDMIAGGDVLKYDAVLKIDYNTIFMKLLKMKISDKFEKRYHEIIEQQNSSKNKR